MIAYRILEIAHITGPRDQPTALQIMPIAAVRRLPRVSVTVRDLRIIASDRPVGISSSGWGWACSCGQHDDGFASCRAAEELRAYHVRSAHGK